MRKISDNKNYIDMNNLRFRSHYYVTMIHNPHSKFTPGASISKISSVYEYIKFVNNPPAPKNCKNDSKGPEGRRFRILTESEKNKFKIHSALKNTTKKFSLSADDRIRKLSMDVIYNKGRKV